MVLLAVDMGGSVGSVFSSAVDIGELVGSVSSAMDVGESVGF